MVGLSSENTAVIISVLRHVCMVSQTREQKSFSRGAFRIAFLENESESRRFLRAHKISSSVSFDRHFYYTKMSLTHMAVSCSRDLIPYLHSVFQRKIVFW